jgi:hypothetical protein
LRKSLFSFNLEVGSPKAQIRGVPEFGKPLFKPLRIAVGRLLTLIWDNALNEASTR